MLAISVSIFEGSQQHLDEGSDLATWLPTNSGDWDVLIY